MKILYGVNGEGMGHAMRSAEIIKELSKNNNLQIIAGGKAADYLKKIGNLKKVNYLSFVSKNGKIDYFKTLLLNLVKSPFLLYNLLYLIIKSLIKRPKLIITDFEPLTAYLGFILRIPVISFDNQHIITDASIPNLKNSSSKLLYKIIVYAMMPFPKKKIITSFFFPKILKKNSILVKPIIREIITKQKPEEGKELLVYLSLENDAMIKKLEKSKRVCMVYGKTNLKSSKYLKIKKFDEQQFAKDLANSKAVICNAGMTTLTESIYLKKPILCMPIKGQIEQELNAYYIQKKGYGLSKKNINEKTINKFLTNLKTYEKSLKKINFSNKKIIKTIKRSINEVTSH